ncbi:pyridoxamine 5'-phosphate oxidase [Ornithinimicrobium sediminis]|uniref:pyridoxamine 5'-phosphate oxidase n=1 Tax=Ornithinimicrobium sediminis TaxID=2904603 RepID=UPI001E466DCE|nr:pyridoxamine 5'-phosphate oxidase [Ornithinimicrobium sediminis]MCE0485738.1 pyridoxamine 5'-phosphate oxidase [Ornithinimicrobium sediminis]
MALDGRIDYTGEGLAEADLAPTPLQQIAAWVEAAVVRHAQHGDVPEPMALSVATVDATGQPDVRTVLMRMLEPRGLGFLTNLQSAKGDQIRTDARVAASLVWPSMFRAVRLQGVAVPVEREAVAAYFRSRPWSSRISAWASAQSRPASSREDLERQHEEYAARFPDHGGLDDVPVPDFWGGYWVEPHRVEFWAGRPSRLHDRLVLTRTREGDLSDASAWTLTRLQP